MTLPQPGDALLDFVLGPVRVARLKAAQDFGMGPKPIGPGNTRPYPVAAQPPGTTLPDIEFAEALTKPDGVTPMTLAERTGVSTRNLMLPSQPPADFSTLKPVADHGPVTGGPAPVDVNAVGGESIARDPSFLEQYGTPLALGAGALGVGALGGLGLHAYMNRDKKKEAQDFGMGPKAPWIKSPLDRTIAGAVGVPSVVEETPGFGPPNTESSTDFQWGRPLFDYPGYRKPVVNWPPERPDTPVKPVTVGHPTTGGAETAVEMKSGPGLLDQYGTPLAIGAGALGVGALGGLGLHAYMNRDKKKPVEVEKVALDHGFMGAAGHGLQLSEEAKREALRYGLLTAGLGVSPALTTAGAVGGGLGSAATAYPNEAGRDGARGAMIGGATGAGLGIGGAVGGFAGGPLGALAGAGLGAAGGGLGMRAILGKPKLPRPADEKGESGKQAANPIADAWNATKNWTSENVGQPLQNNIINPMVDAASQRAGNNAATAFRNNITDNLTSNPYVVGGGLGALAGGGLAALGGMGSKRKKKDRFGDIAMGGLLGAGAGLLGGGLYSMYGGKDTPPAPTQTPTTNVQRVTQLPTDPTGRPPIRPNQSALQTAYERGPSNVADAATNSPETVRNIANVTVPGFDTSRRAITALDQTGQYENSDQLAQAYLRAGTAFKSNDPAQTNPALGGLLRQTAAGQQGRPDPTTTGAVGGPMAVGLREQTANGRVTARDAGLGFGLGSMDADRGRATLAADSPKAEQALRAFNETIAANPNANFNGGEGKIVNTPFAHTVGETTLATMLGRNAIRNAVGGMQGDQTQLAAKALAKQLNNPPAAAGGPGLVGRSVGALRTAANQFNPLAGLSRSAPTTPFENNSALIDRLVNAANARPGATPVTTQGMHAALTGGKTPGVTSAELRDLASQVYRGGGAGIIATPPPPVPVKAPQPSPQSVGTMFGGTPFPGSPSVTPRPATPPPSPQAVPVGHAAPSGWTTAARGPLPKPTPPSIGQRIGGGTGRFVQNAARSLPVGLGVGLLRQMGQTPSYTTPFEDLTSGLRPADPGAVAPPTPTAPPMTFEQYQQTFPPHVGGTSYPGQMEQMYQDYLRRQGR